MINVETFSVNILFMCIFYLCYLIQQFSNFAIFFFFTNQYSDLKCTSTFIVKFEKPQLYTVFVICSYLLTIPKMKYILILNTHLSSCYFFGSRIIHRNARHSEKKFRRTKWGHPHLSSTYNADFKPRELLPFVRIDSFEI